VGEHRHKRDTEARRKPQALAVIAPLAVLATAAAVTVGVVALDPAARDLTPLSAAPAAIGSAAGAADTSGDSSDDGAGADAAAAPDASAGDPTASASADPFSARTDDPVTRTESRMKMRSPQVVEPRFMSKAATQAAVDGAQEKLWATDDLNLWTQPGDKAKQVGLLEQGDKVLVTGREIWGRTEVVVEGQSRWVTDGYLSDEEPPTLGGDCTNGTSVASGVSPSIVAVHEAVCANFPDISVYGTLRGGGGDHPLGKAVDIMVSGSEGWEVAEFVRANYAALGVSYVIYSQKIWSVERSGEGWRGMENRGSITANHFDHVHVSVY
jgi:hypothetical protein